MSLCFGSNSPRFIRRPAMGIPKSLNSFGILGETSLSASEVGGGISECAMCFFVVIYFCAVFCIGSNMLVIAFVWGTYQINFGAIRACLLIIVGGSHVRLVVDRVSPAHFGRYTRMLVPYVPVII